MIIYLLRHGLAEETAASDAARELTPDGIKQNRSMVAKFKEHSPILDKAIMSPFQRARQTASSLRMIFPEIRFDVEKSIEPDGDVYDVLDALEGYGAQHLLLVSHNPFLSNLLSVLVDGTLETDRQIGNSTLVCVAMDFVAPGCGEILYTIEP